MIVKSNKQISLYTLKKKQKVPEKFFGIAEHSDFCPLFSSFSALNTLVTFGKCISRALIVLLRGKWQDLLQGWTMGIRESVKGSPQARLGGKTSLSLQLLCSFAHQRREGTLPLLWFLLQTPPLSEINGFFSPVFLNVSLSISLSLEAPTRQFISPVVHLQALPPPHDVQTVGSFI